MTTRRKILIGGSFAALGLYSHNRGLRYPRLGFEPDPPDASIASSSGNFSLTDAIAINRAPLEFRAIAPEPSIELHAKRGRFSFSINNIATNASLEVQKKGVSNLDEDINGTTRNIIVDSAESQSISLRWRIADQKHLKFAVIGDTGGNVELDWCLRRAKSLDAQFLLHLGDFNYGRDDYQQAIGKFHAAPLPCYVSIGNHDFHDNGLIYHSFLQQLGPMNNAFTLNGVRFANIDTAADFFPASSGNRRKLFDSLHKSPSSRQVFFTHRPLRDPRPGQDHTIGGVNEIPWLVDSIKQAGGGDLLTGHVHHSTELEFEGLKQYTAGEGLGHEDIILRRQTARMLMGTIEEHNPVSFEWASLDMPWSFHRSHTHQLKLENTKDQLTLDWYQNLLKT